MSSAPGRLRPLGSWTLLDAGTMLAAPHCTSPFANGEVRFVEDRTGPPSRTYLKLWEALTLIARLPGVEHRRESAFAVDPRVLGAVDWLFSDIVCYPPRLLALIERWLAAGTCRRFACTLKFQGATDHATAHPSAAISGSRLRHLFHNKHELTWIKIE